MKIIPENIINNIRNITRKQNPVENQSRAEAALKTAGRDEIIIAANLNTEISDEQFIAQLKKSVLSEIQTGASEYTLESLKQQIALNEYDINTPDIIRKMLLDKYEVSYE